MHGHTVSLSELFAYEQKLDIKTEKIEGPFIPGIKVSRSSDELGDLMQQSNERDNYEKNLDQYNRLLGNIRQQAQPHGQQLTLILDMNPTPNNRKAANRILDNLYKHDLAVTLKEEATDQQWIEYLTAQETSQYQHHTSLCFSFKEATSIRDIAGTLSATAIQTATDTVATSRRAGKKTASTTATEAVATRQQQPHSPLWSDKQFKRRKQAQHDKQQTAKALVDVYIQVAKHIQAQAASNWLWSSPTGVEQILSAADTHTGSDEEIIDKFKAIAGERRELARPQRDSLAQQLYDDIFYVDLTSLRTRHYPAIKASFFSNQDKKTLQEITLPSSRQGRQHFLKLLRYAGCLQHSTSAHFQQFIQPAIKACQRIAETLSTADFSLTDAIDSLLGDEPQDTTSVHITPNDQDKLFSLLATAGLLHHKQTSILRVFLDTLQPDHDICADYLKLNDTQLRNALHLIQTYGLPSSKHKPLLQLINAQQELNEKGRVTVDDTGLLNALHLIQTNNLPSSQHKPLLQLINAQQELNEKGLVTVDDTHLIYALNFIQQHPLEKTQLPALLHTVTEINALLDDKITSEHHTHAHSALRILKASEVPNEGIASLIKSMATGSNNFTLTEYHVSKFNYGTGEEKHSFHSHDVFDDELIVINTPQPIGEGGAQKKAMASNAIDNLGKTSADQLVRYKFHIHGSTCRPDEEDTEALELLLEHMAEHARRAPDILAPTLNTEQKQCKENRFFFKRGSELKQRLDTQPEITLEETLDIASQLFVELKKIPYTHRDLKPENIIVFTNEQSTRRTLKLIDLSINSTLDTLECSYLYTSPNELIGRILDYFQSLYVQGRPDKLDSYYPKTFLSQCFLDLDERRRKSTHPLVGLLTTLTTQIDQENQGVKNSLKDTDLKTLLAQLNAGKSAEPTWKYLYPKILRLYSQHDISTTSALSLGLLLCYQPKIYFAYLDKIIISIHSSSRHRRPPLPMSQDDRQEKRNRITQNLAKQCYSAIKKAVIEHLKDKCDYWDLDKMHNQTAPRSSHIYSAGRILQEFLQKAPECEQGTPLFTQLSSLTQQCCRLRSDTRPTEQECLDELAQMQPSQKSSTLRSCSP